jgi:hypothetical protein
VIGTATAITGAVAGVSGFTSSYNGFGVMGTATAPTNTPIGVYGNSPNSEFGIGVLGWQRRYFLSFEGTSGLMADGSNGLAPLLLRCGPGSVRTFFHFHASSGRIAVIEPLA